ncbi:P-loop containing nucleoside triphosphate hydrolase protein [Mycena polygramma]|nr:P-loop containing nucleoside triphosphate hydrolase protein [Mycena polygramma]
MQCGLGPSIGSIQVQEMEADNEVLHREVMALIKSTADTCSSTTSVWSLHNSSSSLFLLFPPRPKLFHGRQGELNSIIAMLAAQDSPRVAILGSGGIGKTALALAGCHHPNVQAKFPHRHFTSCESAFSSADIVSALAAHLDIPESAQTLKDVLHQLSSRVEPTLLVLDNLETTWEPSVSRAGVEDLLTHLADISHVALLATMRGAERPSKVRWTRPFLPPLEPLSREAAIQTLADIVDDDDDATSSQIHEVLDFTDNMPLAVTLLGAIISFEGYAKTIERWKLENTALLSEGHAKDSNLDKSIAMSLSSPRMTSSPGARDLLSVLCLLPSGISDSDFTMLGLPIADLGRAKATLLRTSLASSEDGRLKALSPIRQYIQRTCPPTPALVQPLLQFLRELVNIWSSFRQLPSGDLVPRLKANIGNFRSLFVYAATMEQTREELIQTGLALLKFSHFLSDTSSASDDIFRMIPDIIERAGDDDLHGRYLLQRFIRHYDYDIEDAEALSEKAIQHFEKAGNRAGRRFTTPSPRTITPAPSSRGPGSIRSAPWHSRRKSTTACSNASPCIGCRTSITAAESMLWASRAGLKAASLHSALATSRSRRDACARRRSRASRWATSKPVPSSVRTRASCCLPVRWGATKRIY